MFIKKNAFKMFYKIIIEKKLFKIFLKKIVMNNNQFKMN